MKPKHLRDGTKEIIKNGNLPFTHRPYVDFDSYVLTYKESLKMPHTIINGVFGSGKEAMVYAMYKTSKKINPVIIGNSAYHLEGAEPNVKNKCMLSIPLNGLIFDSSITVENITINGVPSENIFNNLNKLGMPYHPQYLETYKKFCNLKNITSSELNLEYGDFKFLFNPILSIQFVENVNIFYTNSAQCVFEIYALLRYFQYKEYGKNLKFNFLRNEYASSLYTLLAYPDFEYKISIPSNYPLIGVDIPKSKNLYGSLNLLISKIIEDDERFNSLLTIYGEIWELFLSKQYDLAVIKMLGFLEYYYKCKRLTNVPFEVSKNVKVKDFNQDKIKNKIFKFINYKDKVVHEGIIENKRVKNYGIFNINKIFVSHKEDIYFILDMFDHIIKLELEKNNG